MKKVFVFVLSLFTAFALQLNAQGYHLGQLVTNPDGSQGIVFYLNEEGTDGLMVALHDAAVDVPWGPQCSIEGLQ